MTTTLVAVYENSEAAGQAARVVRERGLAREVTVLSRRNDGPEQGYGPVITGPGYGLSAPEQMPPEGEEKLGSGVAMGATLGGTLGMLAATYVVPGVGALTPAGPLVSTLVGAGLGSFVGAMLEQGATESDVKMFAGTVRLGGVLVVAVCAGEQVSECKHVLQGWNALEVREHPGGPVGQAENLKPALTNQRGTEPGPTGTSIAPGQVAGGLALTGGDQRDTGARGPLRGRGVMPGDTVTGMPDDAGEAQPGPGSGAGVG